MSAPDQEPQAASRLALHPTPAACQCRRTRPEWPASWSCDALCARQPVEHRGFAQERAGFCRISGNGAQVIEMGQTVNGIATAALVDWFQFTPATTEPITLEVLAERIDSRMDPTLVILDSQGNELERHHDVQGRDVSVTFKPFQPNQPYYIGLNDFLYDGGASYYYRLSLTKSRIDRQVPVRLPANLPVVALSKEMQAYESEQTLTSIPVSIFGQTPPRARPYIDLVVEEAGTVVIELFSERLGQPTDYRLRVSMVANDGRLKKVIEGDDSDDAVKDKRFRIGS